MISAHVQPTNPYISPRKYTPFGFPKPDSRLEDTSCPSSWSARSCRLSSRSVSPVEDAHLELAPTDNHALCLQT